MTSPTPPSTSPSLEAGPDLKPIYTNLARIAHSPADIVIDFAHMLPGESRAQISARILMSPLSAKLLLRALNENLVRYETAFGQINVPGNPSLADNLFKPINPTPEKPPEP